MAGSAPSTVRKQIAQGNPDPVYLIVGDDEAEMSHLASGLASIVEDELRAFNVERIYASDRSATPASIVESARQLPMMSNRRVVTVLRAEKLLKPKRKGKAAERADAETSSEADLAEARSGAKADEARSGAKTDEAPSGAKADDALEAYVKSPEPQTVLILVASDVDKSRRLYKALAKHATIVECWGLKGSKDAKVDLRQVARQAEELVRRAVADAGQQIETSALRLIAERAGTDIARLRGDVERLLLYAAGKPKITIADAREVVSAESAQDDWAVTNAIGRGDTAEALRQLGLALDSGGNAFMILGQLAWFVREKLPMVDARRVRPAVDSLLRTDLDLKSSGGDTRVLLERLVVELCRG